MMIGAFLVVKNGWLHLETTASAFQDQALARHCGAQTGFFAIIVRQIAMQALNFHQASLSYLQTMRRLPLLLPERVLCRIPPDVRRVF
jgi:hypothetical protein